MKTILTTLTLLALTISGSAQAYWRPAYHPVWHSAWHPAPRPYVYGPRPVMYSPWHTGYWHQGWHDGRAGWWWVHAGLWNYYTTPVYPYPAQPYVVEVPAPAPPPVIIPAPVPSTVVVNVPPPPPVQTAVIPHLPTAGDNTLFYCASANAYFPYVPECGEGWQLKQGTAAH